MPRYQVKVGGDEYEIDAPDEARRDQAVKKLREQREAITEPAITGAKARANEALAQHMETVEPRLASSYRVDNRAAAIPGAAAAAGVSMLPQSTAGQALVGAAPGLLEGDLPKAAKGAAIAAVGGKVLQYAPRAISALIGRAAPVAEEAAAVAPQTVGAMMGSAPAAAEAAPQTVGALMSGTKSVAPLTAESVLEKVAQLQARGLSRGQIIASLKETHGMKPSQAMKVYDLIKGLQ